MYYANAQQLTEEITGLVNSAEPPLRWFCIDVSAVDDVDYSAAETLRSICGILKEKGVRLVIAKVLEEVNAESRYELRRLFGEDAFYDTLEEVVKAYQQQWGAEAK
jgi:MFS superfamily sulfate permease-like transporter